jgi:hypothetical protein
MDIPQIPSDARTVIVVLVASQIALTTTKPLDTNENGRNDWCWR